MAFLKTANRAESTLDGGISDADLSLDVAVGEGALFPAAGDFHITIEDEILVCTARAGDTLTVTRAAEGTAAAAHADGKAVELRITKGVIDAIEAEINAKVADADFTAAEEVMVGTGAATHNQITLAASQVLGMLAAGNTTNVTMAQLWAILSGAAGATVDMNGQKFTNITGIWDNDGDTGIQVEESADEDTIRMDVGGTGGANVFVMHGNGILDITKQAGVQGNLGSSQSVPSGGATWTKLLLDEETFDVQNEFVPYVDNATTQARYTATEAGRYFVMGKSFINTANENNLVRVRVYKNGANIMSKIAFVVHNGDAPLTVSEIPSIAANDYLELYVYHNYGANRNYYGAAGCTSNSLLVYKLS